MTVDTKIHFKIHPSDPVHGFDRPMALGAGNLHLDMPFVVEDHVLSQIIGFSPRRGCPGIEIPMLFFDLGMVSDYVFMAIEALFHRRHTRMLGKFHIGMTELTLDLLHTRMDMMAKGYGLFRPYVRCWRSVEQV